MTARPQWNEDDEWNPATSDPGQAYTPEGQIKSFGALARGLSKDDPRLRPYRRQMWRSAAIVLALGLGLIVAVAILTAVF